MIKNIFLFLLIWRCISAAVAGDWHPGVSGQDAPGGKAVKVPLGDLQMHGVLYYPESYDQTIDNKLPAVVLVHGWSPYGTRAGEPYSYAAKEYANEGGAS